MYKLNFQNIFKVLILFSLLSWNCSNKKEDYSEKEIVNNVVSTLETERLSIITDNNFLVSPVVGNFEFNDFLKNVYESKIKFQEPKSKNKVLDLLGISDDEFNKLQLENSENTFDEKRLDYSSSNESDTILVFSSFGNDLVFLEAFKLNKSLTKNDLLNRKDFEENLITYCSYSIIRKHNEIKTILIDNCINWD